MGIAVMPLDLDALTSTLPASRAAFYCAAPSANGLDDGRIARALRHLPPPKEGLLYLSTTGVYGDCQGRWITESETLKPKTERGLRRLAAEAEVQLYANATGSKTVTLRVPGIYGPGRLPVQRLRAGTPILRREDAPFSNRIHADDLAAAAVLALRAGEVGAAYNVSDGAPTTMTDYFLQCAEFLGLPAPPQISLAEAQTQLSATLLSYFEESKRLDISRLKALGFVPQYPNLQQGLLVPGKEQPR